MRFIYLASAIIAVTALLWLAGEQHRQNCISAGKVSCSVLPWDNGERVEPQAPPLPPPSVR